MKDITITEILDDLRASDEIIRRLERRYWLSSADFYELYQQGLLDDGDNLEEFMTWAGFYEIKLAREADLARLSKERVRKLKASITGGAITITTPEPALPILID